MRPFAFVYYCVDGDSGELGMHCAKTSAKERRPILAPRDSLFFWIVFRISDAESIWPNSRRD